MTSIIFFLIFIPILGIVLLVINLIFAIHKPYKEKKTSFECGYHSFSQSRNPFSVVFFTVGMLFIILDIEVTAIFPLSVSLYLNEGYGLSVAIFFILVLTVGFFFEIGKKAIKIDTKQDKHYSAKKEKNIYISNSFCNIPMLTTYFKLVGVFKN